MRQSKQWKRLLLSACSAGCAVLLFAGSAHADVYQSVSAGQTLRQLSQKFHVSTNLLRQANHLRYSDTAKLPDMLLRIPDAHSIAKKAAPTRHVAALKKPKTSPIPQTRGTFSTTQFYTVSNGDSWKSIAKHYQSLGYNLNASQLRQQNSNVQNLSPNSQIKVVLTRHYDTKSGDSGSIGAASDDGYATAEVIPQPKPLYNHSSQRGPVNLASRGSFNSRNGIRQLSGSEEMVIPLQKSTSKPQNTAQLAKVVRSGARIRRSPRAKSATLFTCPVGTKLAVTGHKGYWFAVLMSDKSTGWLPAKYVDIVSDDLDLQTQVSTGSEAREQFQGPGMFRENGHLASNNPLISTALTWMGTPYVYGGESRRGVDCSSFVQHVFRANGINLPRTARQQATVGTPVAESDLQTGDRLYFSARHSYIDHTGIYIGNGKFIHASGSRRGVTISKLSNKFYQRIYVGARR